ncbi:hypothetical protein ALC62_01754, partial [Cyphomyrmex costatus]
SFHVVIRFDFYWLCFNERVIVIKVLEKSANIVLTQCDASCTGLSVCTFEFENNVLLPAFKIVPEQPDNTSNTMKIAVSYVYTVITRRFIRVTNRHTAFQVMENGLTVKNAIECTFNASHRPVPISFQVLNGTKRSSHSGESRSGDCMDRHNRGMETCAIISDISPRFPDSLYRNPLYNGLAASLAARDDSLAARVTKRGQPVFRRENPRLRNVANCAFIFKSGYRKTFDALTLRKLESSLKRKIAKNEDGLAAILIKNCKHLSRADRRFVFFFPSYVLTISLEHERFQYTEQQAMSRAKSMRKKIHADVEVSRIYGVYQETNPGHVPSLAYSFPKQITKLRIQEINPDDLTICETERVQEIGSCRGGRSVKRSTPCGGVKHAKTLAVR